MAPMSRIAFATAAFAFVLAAPAAWAGTPGERISRIDPDLPMAGGTQAVVRAISVSAGAPCEGDGRMTVQTCRGSGRDQMLRQFRHAGAQAL